MFSRGILKSCRGLAAQQSRKYASSIPQPATQVTTLPNGEDIMDFEGDFHLRTTLPRPHYRH